MDSHNVASLGSSVGFVTMSSVAKLSSIAAASMAKWVTLSVASFSAAVRLLEALVRSDSPKGNG